MIYHGLEEHPDYGNVVACTPQIPGGSIVGRFNGVDLGGSKAYLTEVDDDHQLYFRLGVDPRQLFPYYIEQHPDVPGQLRTIGKTILLIEHPRTSRLLVNPSSFYETVPLDTLVAAVRERKARRSVSSKLRTLPDFSNPGS